MYAPASHGISVSPLKPWLRHVLIPEDFQCPKDRVLFVLTCKGTCKVLHAVKKVFSYPPIYCFRSLYYPLSYALLRTIILCFSRISLPTVHAAFPPPFYSTAFTVGGDAAALSYTRGLKLTGLSAHPPHLRPQPCTLNPES